MTSQTKSDPAVRPDAIWIPFGFLLGTALGGYLDDYLKSVSAGVFTQHYFGPEPPIDGVPRHYFKAYYFDLGVFEVLGRRYEISPLVEELQRIHHVLIKSGKGGRFRSP